MEITPYFFDFSNWRDRVIINWDKEVVRKATFGRNIKILVLMKIRCQMEMLGSNWKWFTHHHCSIPVFCICLYIYLYQRVLCIHILLWFSFTTFYFTWIAPFNTSVERSSSNELLQHFFFFFWSGKISLSCIFEKQCCWI